MRVAIGSYCVRHEPVRAMEDAMNKVLKAAIAAGVVMVSFAAVAADDVRKVRAQPVTAAPAHS